MVEHTGHSIISPRDGMLRALYTRNYPLISEFTQLRTHQEMSTGIMETLKTVKEVNEEMLRQGNAMIAEKATTVERMLDIVSRDPSASV